MNSSSTVNGPRNHSVDDGCDPNLVTITLSSPAHNRLISASNCNCLSRNESSIPHCFHSQVARG